MQGEDLLDLALSYGDKFREKTWHVGMMSRGRVIALDGMFLNEHLDEEDHQAACAQAVASILMQASALIAEAVGRGNLKEDHIKSALGGLTKDD
jgi:hypothetical protein